jgi:hypothetical protein
MYCRDAPGGGDVGPLAFGTEDRQAEEHEGHQQQRHTQEHRLVEFRLPAPDHHTMDLNDIFVSYLQDTPGSLNNKGASVDAFEHTLMVLSYWYHMMA